MIVTTKLILTLPPMVYQILLLLAPYIIKEEVAIQHRSRIFQLQLCGSVNVRTAQGYLVLVDKSLTCLEGKCSKRLNQFYFPFVQDYVRLIIKAAQN